jgi:hypothetical protein
LPIVVDACYRDAQQASSNVNTCTCIFDLKAEGVASLMGVGNATATRNSVNLGKHFFGELRSPPNNTTEMVSTSSSTYILFRRIDKTFTTNRFM